ncbi:MAG: VOC family protein [Rhodobacteraceae bacterium]|jgi:predicted enzyme related to lactoylglutathione lyase|nr:VOC family protein [Paracoccaceae bacterium]
MSDQGAPCWYELATADPAASQAFYGPLLGWEFQDAGMPDFTYILALSGADMVAGLMQPDAPMPEFWMVYFAVDDCDAAAARVVDLGGGVHRPPEDIPGTGRFTIVTDPQGAAFGLLQPLSGGTGSAFDRSQNGHGNWHELHSTAPEAALAFYRALLGWQATEAIPMGAEMGSYQLFAHAGQNIGGMLRLMAPPGAPSHWLPYFVVPSVVAARDGIAAAGGTVLQDPAEVPGGVHVVMAQDPRGAKFAVVGPL